MRPKPPPARRARRCGSGRRNEAIEPSADNKRVQNHRLWKPKKGYNNANGSKGHRMSQAIIENPVINSPFEEPRRHFRFDDNGINDEIVSGRRLSTCFIPVAKPTDGVSFNTSRATYQTNYKCHISHVALDSGWEGRMAQALEYMDEVYAYVKNQNLDFRIPYAFEGQPHSYIPDFIARIEDGHGQADLLNLIIEVSGPPLPAKAAKTAMIQNLWVPAVNNSGQFGRWAFVEVKDPDSAMQTIRMFIDTFKKDLKEQN